MIFRSFAPPAALADVVECAWSMRAAGRAAAPAPERVLPDGCVELIVHLGERFAEWVSAAATHPQPRSFVLASLTRPVLLAPPAAFDTFGLRFRPGAARVALGVPLAALADRVVPLEALWGAEARRWEERLAACRDAGARAAEAFRAIAARTARAPDRVVRAAVEATIARRGAIQVAPLAARLGLSARQVERRFADEVGVGPKAFARVVRLQDLLRRLGAGADSGWLDLALDLGYADQTT